METTSRPTTALGPVLTLSQLATQLGVSTQTTPLPPWDPRLTPANQRFVHATEVSLLTLQFLVPATGLLLLGGSDDLFMVHIAAHVVFFLTLAAHLGMVIGKKLVTRMLPWGRGRSTPAH